MGAAQRFAGLHRGLDLRGIHLAVLLVRQQQVHDVGLLGSLGHGHHLEAVLHRSVPALAGAQTDDHMHTAVAHAKRLGTALRTIANDGHRLSVQEAYIAVLIMENIHGCNNEVKDADIPCSDVWGQHSTLCAGIKSNNEV